MKNIPHPFDEAEETAWILIAVLAALILAFGYLLWQRTGCELPQSRYPEVQIRTAASADSGCDLQSLS